MTVKLVLAHSQQSDAGKQPCWEDAPNEKCILKRHGGDTILVGRGSNPRAVYNFLLTRTLIMINLGKILII